MNKLQEPLSELETRMDRWQTSAEQRGTVSGNSEAAWDVDERVLMPHVFEDFSQSLYPVFAMDAASRISPLRGISGTNA